MHINYFSLGLSLLAFIGLFIAYNYYRKHQVKLCLALLLLSGLVLRISVASDPFIHEWDEQYHALVAKHLSGHVLQPTLYDNPVLPYDAENWVANHIWLEKGPVPLLLAALSYNVFGPEIYAIRVPSLLLSLLSIYITFLIGKNLFNTRIALIAAFLHSINGLLIEVAGGRVSSDLVETAFCFFVEWGIYLALLAIKEKKTYTASFFIGLITSLALLCKWNPALIIPIVWFAAALGSSNYTTKQLILCSVLIVAGILSLFLPCMLYAYYHYPNELRVCLGKFIFAYQHPVEQHTGPWYYYLNSIRMVFGELIYLPLLFSLFILIKKNSRKLLVLCTWWLIPLLVFSIAATKRHTYLLIAAPAFFLCTAYCFYYLDALKSKLNYPRIISLIQLLLLLLPLRYCIERVKPITSDTESILLNQEIKKLALSLPVNDPKTILFHVKHPIKIMYYFNCIAYAELPAPDQLKQLQMKGYKVFVNDAGNKEEDYLNAGLQMIHIDI